MKKRTPTVLGSIILTTSILLAPMVHSAGWTDALTVDEVWVEDNLIVVGTSGGAGVYTTGCSSSKYIITLADTETRNHAISILLTAATTGKSVKLWYKDTCANWNYHSATSTKFIGN